MLDCKSPSSAREFYHELIPLDCQHGVGFVFIQVGGASDDEEPGVPLRHGCCASDRSPSEGRGLVQGSRLAKVGYVEDRQPSMLSVSTAAAAARGLLCWRDVDFPAAVSQRDELCRC